MADFSVGIKRNGVPVAAGAAVLPNEKITLTAQLGGLVGGDTVRFTIRDSGGTEVFGPKEKVKDLFQEDVNLDAVAPAAAGAYTLEGDELILLYPDRHASFPFRVDPKAPAPPEPSKGLFGDIKTLLILGIILVVALMLFPVVTTVTRAAKGG